LLVAGNAALVKIWMGIIPINCAAADLAGSNLLVTFTLDTDWLPAASSGSSTVISCDAIAINDGDAAFFRLYDSTGATCHAQGTVAVTNGDLPIDDINIVAGQSMVLTNWTLIQPGA